MADIREAQAVEKVIQGVYDALEQLPNIEKTGDLTEPIKHLVDSIARHYDIETVTCCVCRSPTPAITAHLHQDEWIGDSCCWKDHYRASE